MEALLRQQFQTSAGYSHDFYSKPWQLDSKVVRQNIVILTRTLFIVRPFYS